MSTPPLPAEIISQSPLAPFLTSKVPPPVAQYVDTRDSLLIQIFSYQPAIPYSIRFRLLRNDGQISEFQRTITSTGLYAIDTLNIPLAEGFLLAVSVHPDGSALSPGHTYCKVFLTRGGIAFQNFTQVLIAGHITQHFPQSWPGNTLKAPLDDKGAIFQLVGVNPAPGAEVNFVLPNNGFERWKIRGIFFTLVCNATVATRTVNLQLTRAGTTWYDRPAETDLTAGQTGIFFCTATGYAPRSNISRIAIELPRDLEMTFGDSINTLTTNIQAGDDFNAPRAIVEQTMEG